MALLTDIIVSARAETAHDQDTQVTDPQITLWANEEYFALRRRLADLVPDLYTAVTADFTIASGASSITLTAGPLSLTDFGKVRTVERKEGSFYVPIGVASPLMSGVTGTLSFLRRGAATIDFYPADLAPGTYRVKYLTKPAILAGAGAVDLPDGCERVLVESVCARICVRMSEDPSYHEAARDKAWREIIDSLRKMYVSTPQTITDVTGRY